MQQLDAVIGPFSFQDFDQLIPDPFISNELQPPGHFRNVATGLVLNFKIKLAGKTNRPKHAKRIFLESVHRLAHRPNYFLPQIFLSPKQINNFIVICLQLNNTKLFGFCIRIYNS